MARVRAPLWTLLCTALKGVSRVAFISCDGCRAEEDFLRGRIVATQSTAALLLFMLITAWCGSGLGVVIANVRQPPRCCVRVRVGAWVRVEVRVRYRVTLRVSCIGRFSVRATARINVRRNRGTLNEPRGAPGRATAGYATVT